MKFFHATVVWYDMFTNECAVLIDGRAHTTTCLGVATVEPGQRVVVTEAGFLLVGA